MWIAFYTRVGLRGGIVRTEIRCNRKVNAAAWYYFWCFWYVVNPFSTKVVSLRREVNGVTVLKSKRGMSQNADMLKDRWDA